MGTKQKGDKNEGQRPPTNQHIEGGSQGQGNPLIENTRKETTKMTGEARKKKSNSSECADLLAGLLGPTAANKSKL
jgi:hypothetical protein